MSRRGEEARVAAESSHKSDDLTLLQMREKADFDEVMIALPKDNSSSLLQTKPHVAFMREAKTGKSLLQLAVEREAIPDCVRQLCRLNSEAMKERHAGLIPFEHILDKELLTSLEAQYILIMLSAEPELATGRWGESSQETPLHKLMSHKHFPSELQEATLQIIKLHPVACSMAADGELPLHRFIASGANCLPVLLQLLRTYPIAASVRCRGGRMQGTYPLHSCLINRLDSTIVRVVFQAFPAAALKRMTSSSVADMAVLDYAMKNQLGGEIIELLAMGSLPLKEKEKDLGEGEICNRDHPKHVAYARAAVLGLFTREHSIEQQPQMDANEMDRSTSLRRYRKRMCAVTVKPFHPHATTFKFYLDPSTTVEELKEHIRREEGTLPELQHLEDESGDRLLHGEVISTYGDAETHLIVNVFLTMVNDTAHVAIKELGNVSILTDVLRIIPNVAQRADMFGRLPLHVALESECEDSLIQLLYDRHPKAATTACGKAGYPIELAVHRSAQDTVVKRLLEHIGEEDWDSGGLYRPDGERLASKRYPPLLHSMVEHRYSYELLKALLDTGYPVEVRDPATGTTAFEAAVTAGAPDAVIAVIKEAHEKVDPNFLEVAASDGRTPIHIAAASGVSLHVLDMLISSGGYSMFHARDGNGQLPLHLAATYGLSHEVVREIALANTEAVYQPDTHGRTPLQLAICHKAPPGVVFEMGRHLVDAVGIKDKRNRSLLMLAVKHDAPLYILHELLEAFPELVEDVSFISGEWETSAAGQEVRRLAMEQRQSRQAGQEEPRPVQVPSSRKQSGSSSQHQDGASSGTQLGNDPFSRDRDFDGSPSSHASQESVASNRSKAEFCPSM